MAQPNRAQRRRWYVRKTLDGLARLYGVNESAVRTVAPEMATRLIAASDERGGGDERSDELGAGGAARLDPL